MTVLFFYDGSLFQVSVSHYFSVAKARKLIGYNPVKTTDREMVEILQAFKPRYQHLLTRKKIQ